MRLNRTSCGYMYQLDPIPNDGESPIERPDEIRGRSWPMYRKYSKFSCSVIDRHSDVRPHQNLGGGYRWRQPAINKNVDNNVAQRCDACAWTLPLARLTRAKLIASAGSINAPWILNNHDGKNPHEDKRVARQGCSPRATLCAFVIKERESLNPRVVIYKRWCTIQRRVGGIKWSGDNIVSDKQRGENLRRDISFMIKEQRLFDPIIWTAIIELSWSCDH